MKYSNLRAFEKHLEGTTAHHFADLYAILSKDDFERKSAVDLLIQFLFTGQKNPQAALKVVEAENTDIEGMLMELNAFSLLSEKRAVLINHADKLPKASCEKLEAYFLNPNRTICLILVAPSILATTNFYKKIEKAGVILELGDEKPWEKEKTLIDWAASKVATEGKQIEPQALQYLVKHVGNDQGLLHQELEKLFCYRSEHQILTFQDVMTICTSVNIENIWQLGEAIFRREGAAALQICKALLEEGTPFLTLLRQIRNQFQTEYQVCSILSKGGTKSDVARQFPYMKGHIIERPLQNAQSYGMERFKRGMLKIDETEGAVKSSTADPDLLAELLIIKLVS
jgi:DNA polymerase-3 subunit delta